MILIQKRLKYPIWKIPYFFINSIIIFIKLVNAGSLNLLINRDFFSKKINIILKSINFIFFRGDEEDIGKKILVCLVKLGPGYIKFGQALSTRPDILGEKICEHLKKLQDDIKPCSTILSKKIIESESHESIDEIFSSFTEIPIATASVAQVHKGILKNGDKVAIKLLKPNIEKSLL